MLAAEEPSRIARRRAARRPRRARATASSGETTRYVVEKAPCRVILTAPPGEDGDGAPSRGRARSRTGSLVCAHMFVLIVGCGRVGSSIAKSMLAEGHEVSVLDEDPEAIALLDRGQDESWEDLGGSFTVGTALEIDALLAGRASSAPTPSSPPPTATTPTS